MVIATVGAGVLTNLLTGGAQQWDQAASIVSAIVAVVGLLVSVVAAFIAQRASNSAVDAAHNKESLAFGLLFAFSNIEKEALKPRWNIESPSRQVSLREIRSAMIEASVWEERDVILFDLATQTRNAVVHGDLDEIDPIDLRYATEKAELLLGKMRAASAD